jgi:protein tyrosine phosphatase
MNVSQIFAFASLAGTAIWAVVESARIPRGPLAISIPSSGLVNKERDAATSIALARLSVMTSTPASTASDPAKSSAQVMGREERLDVIRSKIRSSQLLDDDDITAIQPEDANADKAKWTSDDYFADIDRFEGLVQSLDLASGGKLVTVCGYDKGADHFTNVLPYEHNVVKFENGMRSNGSVITLPSLNIKFILTSSPHKNSQLVYDPLQLEAYKETLTREDVQLIVRLDGQFHEGLPSTKTIFSPDNGLQEVIIPVLLMKAWNDFSDTDKGGFVEFFAEYSAKLRELQEAFGNKMLSIMVHCRAGVGRSGTFVTYHVAQLMKLHSRAAIVRFIKNMRCYRTQFVQQPVQLEFLFQLLADQ